MPRAGPVCQVWPNTSFWEKASIFVTEIPFKQLPGLQTLGHPCAPSHCTPLCRHACSLHLNTCLETDHLPQFRSFIWLRATIPPTWITPVDSPPVPCFVSVSFPPATLTTAARLDVSTCKSNCPLLKTLQRHQSDSQGTLKPLRRPVWSSLLPLPHSHTRSAPATLASFNTQALSLPRAFALAITSVWKGFCPHDFRFLFPHLLFAKAFPGVVNTGMRGPDSSSGTEDLLLPSSRIAMAEEGYTSFQGQPYPVAAQHGV